MGKSYASELDMLAATYDWAMGTDITDLVRSVSASTHKSLLAVGSGGSLTTAQIASQLHQSYTHRLAKTVTPLEVVSTAPPLKDVALLLVSASGRNADIAAALKHVVNSELGVVSVLSMTVGSPLSALAAELGLAQVCEFDLPGGEDGFLSTNSLLASCVLLSRAYERVYSAKLALPSMLSSLVCHSGSEAWFLQKLERECAVLWEKDTVIVLYGSATRAAAFDIESKFTEAALGTVQIADYRNFGHGRHHWLAKRGSTTGIIALAANEDHELAEATLSILPSSIPVVRLEIDQQGLAASLAAVTIGMYVAGLAGAARGIDPGRPGVPQFGRRLYSSKTLERAVNIRKSAKNLTTVAVERKAGRSFDELVASGHWEFWQRAYDTFVSGLEHTAFSGIVLDYDGTVCDETHRRIGLPEVVADHLIRILESGVRVAIATGRGQSVKHALREAIPPRLWSWILVGYYNGGDIGLLDDDDHPDRHEEVCAELEPVAIALQSADYLASVLDFTFRKRQITADVRDLAQADEAWESINRLVSAVAPGSVNVLQAPYSIDILARGVSKAEVVDVLARLIGATTANLLCIGDRGRWPGNDSALLMYPYSLSTDEVSSDPGTCWNLAPLGHQGVQATLAYFRALEIDGGKARLEVEHIWRQGK